MSKRTGRSTSALVLAGMLLLPLCAGIHAGSASAASAEPVYAAGDIQEVHMSQADLSFMPYYQERPADRKALAEVADLLNRVTAKGKEIQAPAESGEDLFFRYDMTVSLQDGSSVVLYIAGQDTLAYVREGSPLIALKDADAYSDFLSLEVNPERGKLDKSSVRIGEPVRLSGSDADSEQGSFHLFVDTGNTTWDVPSESGIHFPSKTAILVGQGEYRFGRYDQSFVIPAVGRTWDGKTVPIPTGKVTLISDFGWLQTSHALEIKPASPILLAVNGIPAADEKAQPIAVNGRTMVPLRAAANLLGQKVEWDAQGRNVLIRTAASQASAAGSGQAGIWIDGAEANSDVPPFIRSGVTYVPIRLLADAFRVPVEWLSGSHVVNLTVS
ncbi:stalk domain-containing protein [Cohnella zeiphila]|uniref:Copper amine oxidase-like N-terminal domain-containing protein n=1 Tax=Cohnella zeiphila TaxID=2761120 RepID=A0A7X0VX07_9BACL|nr:stalk domain-containing protein [Cohnella zeiphila]MBB6733521.1 hypothetical protein [Cohnella zeiphila]